MCPDLWSPPCVVLLFSIFHHAHIMERHACHSVLSKFALVFGVVAAAGAFAGGNCNVSGRFDRTEHMSCCFISLVYFIYIYQTRERTVLWVNESVSSFTKHTVLHSQVTCHSFITLEPLSVSRASASTLSCSLIWPGSVRWRVTRSSSTHYALRPPWSRLASPSAVSFIMTESYTLQLFSSAKIPWCHIWIRFRSVCKVGLATAVSLTQLVKHYWHFSHINL